MVEWNSNLALLQKRAKRTVALRLQSGLRVTLAKGGFVGSRIVREHTLGGEVGEAIDAGDGGDGREDLLLAVCRKADAVHARIDGDVCTDGNARALRRLVELLRVVLREEGLDDVISGEVGGERGVGIAEDEDIRLGVELVANVADSDRLIDTGDGKEIAAFFEQDLDTGGSAMAVGFGFDNGDDTGIGLWEQTVFLMIR